MSLPDSITLADIVGNEVFSTPKDLPNGKLYVAPSPNSDLEGRPTLRVESQRTSKGIERTVLQLTRPLWDAASGTYPKYRTVTATVTRDESDNVTSVENDMVKLASFCSLQNGEPAALASAQI